MKNLQILVEQHSDGFVAYPLGIKGVVVGQGDTYEEALADVESAVLFHIETFGEEVLPSTEPASPIFDRQKPPKGATECSPGSGAPQARRPRGFRHKNNPSPERATAAAPGASPEASPPAAGLAPLARPSPLRGYEIF